VALTYISESQNLVDPNPRKIIEDLNTNNHNTLTTYYTVAAVSDTAFFAMITHCCSANDTAC
jgi:hypothetical protein